MLIGSTHVLGHELLLKYFQLTLEVLWLWLRKIVGFPIWPLSLFLLEVIRKGPNQSWENKKPSIHGLGWTPYWAPHIPNGKHSWPGYWNTPKYFWIPLEALTVYPQSTGDIIFLPCHSVNLIYFSPSLIQTIRTTKRQLMRY